MSEGSMNKKVIKDKNNDSKILIGILAILVVAIVVLTVITVAINIRLSNKKSAANEGVWLEVDKSITEQANDLRTTVEQLIQEDPVNVERINELYDAVIANALKNDRLDYVMTLVQHRNTLLLSKGLKQEALDVLIAGDYSMLSDADQYRIYTNIIELAEALDNEEIVDKYTRLREDVAAEYWIDYGGTEASNEKTNKESENAVRLNDWDSEDE